MSDSGTLFRYFMLTAGLFLYCWMPPKNYHVLSRYLANPTVMTSSFPGAMGKRTVHQIDAKAQLVVLATRSRVGLWQENEGRSRAQLGLDPDAAAAAAASAASSSKETAGLREEEDVFVAPVLIGEDGQVGMGVGWG